MDDHALASAAREVHAKLQAAMPSPEARRLTGAPFFGLHRRTGAPAHARLLRTAIRERRIVMLGYADGSGQHSQRGVHPLAIWTFPDSWMFSGWCDLRQDFRTFRLDRIRDLTATNDRFADDPAKGVGALLTLESCRDHGSTAR